MHQDIPFVSVFVALFLLFNMIAIHRNISPPKMALLSFLIDDNAASLAFEINNHRSFFHKQVVVKTQRQVLQQCLEFHKALGFKQCIGRKHMLT